MVIYPAVAFITLMLDQPNMLIGYLMLILFILAIKKCHDQHWLSGIALFSVVALLTYSLSKTEAQYLVYLPPILILFSLFILFSQSLQAKQTPLITRYAIMLGDPLEDKHLNYNRKLTGIWSAFFLFMTITSTLLAIYSSIEIWSLFTHLISYLLITIFFIIEFIYRKKHFAGEIQGGFFQFIRRIIKIRPHNLKNDN